MKVPVKKVNLYVLQNQYEELLKLLQLKEFMMIEESENSSKTEDLGKLDEQLARINQSIKYLESFRKKRKFFHYKEASYQEFDDRSGSYEELLETIEDLEKRENSQLVKIKELEDEINLYKPFISCDLNLEDMSYAKYIGFYHGFVDLKKLEDLKDFYEENEIAHSIFESDRRGAATTFAVLKNDDKTYLQEAKRLDFKEIKMPVYDGGINEYIDNLKIKKTQYETLLNGTQKEIEGYLKDLNQLYVYADQTASDKLRKQSPYEIHSEELDIVKINGWIKVKREKELRKLLDQNKFDYELEDALKEEEEIVPTALENNKFVEPFEVITEQFSAPSVDDLDPNPSMSIWYWIIFGIMMGDIGYGFLLILGCGLILKLMRPKGGTRKLLTVLFYGGFTTVLFGILHGSFFGFDFDLGKIIGSWFNQNWTTVIFIEEGGLMKNSLQMLIIVLVIGFIQISHGLILNAIRHFKANDWQGALGEGLSHFFILIGLGLLALSFAVAAFSVWIGISVLILGLALLFGFAANDKGIGGAIAGKLSGLYGIIDRLSDILSYSRILALALSTAVIAFTFNTLAGLLPVNFIGIIFSVLIYLIGHIFNLAMGLLSTYIHDSRLQYIEFFGQFFDGGGRYFTPLSLELNHLNEIIHNKDFGGNKI